MKERILQYLKDEDYEIEISVKLYVDIVYPKYPDTSVKKKNRFFYYYIRHNESGSPVVKDICNKWTKYFLRKKKKATTGVFEKSVNKALDNLT